MVLIHRPGGAFPHGWCSQAAMVRLTKITDYALLLMALMARRPGEAPFTSRDLAGLTGISPPMVSKILKLLAREGFLRSTRGANGGYSLASDPLDITVAALIERLEGPVTLTVCSAHDASGCPIEDFCPVSSPLQRINRVVIDTLSNITLAELAEPEGTLPARRWSRGSAAVAATKTG